MKQLSINPAIKRLRIDWYKEYRGDYSYSTKNGLRVYKIPNSTQLLMRWYFNRAGYWSSKMYYWLWKDWKLYNME